MDLVLAFTKQGKDRVSITNMCVGATSKTKIHGIVGLHRRFDDAHQFQDGLGCSPPAFGPGDRNLCTATVQTGRHPVCLSSDAELDPRLAFTSAHGQHTVQSVLSCPPRPGYHHVCVIAEKFGLSPAAPTCSMIWTRLWRLPRLGTPRPLLETVHDRNLDSISGHQEFFKGPPTFRTACVRTGAHRQRTRSFENSGLLKVFHGTHHIGTCTNFPGSRAW